MRTLHVLTLLLLCTAKSACSGEQDAARAPQEGPTAPGAEIDAWLAQGRVLLDAGQALEAEAIFARAAAADRDSLRTRMWVLRAWMDQGRSDETLAALEALEAAGAEGREMSYLWGMAFARRAEDALARGSTDASVGMHFVDATRYLREVLEAEGASYADACLPLARSAWQAQELDTAAWAAQKAVEVRPEAVESWLARGRVAMSRFVAAEAEAAGSARADELWSVAIDSFERALALYGEPTTEAAAAGLADTARALANGLLWRRRFAAATEACATAIAWGPEAFDYLEALRLLGAADGDAEGGERPVGFRAALEAGRARFEQRAGSSDARAATLLWWLGWARFSAADWAGSEEAFLDCMARRPEIANSWFYVALARHYRKDAEGALAAMHSGWDADPLALVTTTRGAGGSLRGFEGLIGWCASQAPARNLEAAFLAEILAEAFPDEPRHWNNLGLFLRDEGERREIEAHQGGPAAPDAGQLAALYERSFSAYRRALELSPDDPQVLNDTALMLQYHLQRDLPEVEAMYRRSIALSDELLSRPELTAEDRARFEQTKQDASGNLRLLLEADEDEDGRDSPGAVAAGSARGG